MARHSDRVRWSSRGDAWMPPPYIRARPRRVAPQATITESRTHSRLCCMGPPSISELLVEAGVAGFEPALAPPSGGGFLARLVEALLARARGSMIERPSQDDRRRGEFQASVSEYCRSQAKQLQARVAGKRRSPCCRCLRRIRRSRGGWRRTMPRSSIRDSPRHAMRTVTRVSSRPVRS